MKPITIAIVDDHAIVRSGIKMLIDAQSDMRVIGEADDPASTLDLLSRTTPDVLLLDIALARTSGLRLLKELREKFSNLRILMLTMHTNLAFVRSALSTGAAGFLLKQAADTDLLTAVRAVARGGTFIDPRLARELFSAGTSTQPDALSTREREVVKLLAQGFGNQQIAARLCVSVKTVETYRARIGDKLGLHTRREITRYALATGLLSVADALLDDGFAA